MKSHRTTLFVSPLLLLLATVAGAQPPATLQPDTTRAVEAALDAADPTAFANPVWAVCVSRHGTIDPVVGWLERFADGADEDRRDQALRLLAHLLRRFGELDRALGALNRIPEPRRSIADALSRAEVMDAQGRTSAAIKAYDALLERDVPTTLSRRLLLRTALMKPVRRNTAKSPLAAAAENWDRELKNQAAIILALQSRHQEALSLFEVSGAGSSRFKQEVRLAEWAIEAKEWRQAQDNAWAAVRSAKMKRDRRYALAVLVEAHRRNNALDGLITQFAEAKELDDDVRLVWIDLLREMGKVDEALRLFRQSADGQGFTNDMRRQLLELCRETGRESTLVAAYENLILEQPKTVEWREGLSRYHLEQGNRTAALDVWKTHLEVVTKTRGRMVAASGLMKLGLDDLANDVARSVIGRSDVATNTAYLFLFELHSGRGKENRARKVLQDLEESAPPEAPVRLDIADAYARLGDKASAARMLQALKDARGARSGTDSDVKLAILYSEIGQEEKAQALWYELWGRVSSIPRRKFVEERLMTVAARLGTLAKIAVDLETKLADGTATARDAGMLVSLYTRVNDAVSATEIVEEHLKQTGAGTKEILVEKARLYLSCHDYHNYAEILRKLIETDPDGRPDHLRELAMNLLERGQRREAREVLTSLKDEPSDTTSIEFEAGVLSLAGMHELARDAYYRSMAASPERIDGYLLLSNTLITLGQRTRAAGMFQHLVAAASKDDLFTISIDGILNLYGPRRRPGPDPLLAWARRLALERVAARPDKQYLYQLVADISDEYGDEGMSLRALQSALPIAGEQRSALLRELMERTTKGSNKPSVAHLMFGRRLLGQGELVPPDVYLKLGTAFLKGKEVVNASRTFNAASRLPEFDELQRKIAGAFESAGFPKEALRVYERLLTVESRAINLLAKVGELHERLGRDDLACGLFERGLDIYLEGKSFRQTLEADTREVSPFERIYVRSSNVDAASLNYPRLMNGLIATLENSDAAATLITRLIDDMAVDLTRLVREGADDPRIGRFPRISARTALMRKLGGAFGLITQVDRMDRALMKTFPSDPALLDGIIRFRVTWGFRRSARALLAASDLPDSEKARHALHLGVSSTDAATGLLKVDQIAPLVLPLLASDSRDKLERILERVDLSGGGAEDLDHIPTLVNASLVIGDADLCLALLRFWVDTGLGHVRDPARLNAVFTTLMFQIQEIRILNATQRQSLMGRIVDRVASDPDRFSTLVRRLYALVDMTEGTLETPQVESLIRAGLSASDRLSFGIPELFAMIPTAERESVFRRLWPLVPRTQRSYFLANYVRLYDIESAASRTFFLDQYTKGLREADSMLTVASVTRRLTQDLRPVNADLVLGMLSAIQKRDPTIKIAFKTIARRILSRPDRAEAWKALTAIWTRFADTDEATPATLKDLIRHFAPTHREELGKLVAGLENKRKKAELMFTLARSKLVTANSQRSVKSLAELRTSLEEKPESVARLALMRDALRTASYWFEAIDIEVRLLAADRSTRTKRSLIANWRTLRNPIKALEIDPMTTTNKRTSRSNTNRKPRGIPGVRMMSTSVIRAPGSTDGLPRVSQREVKAALKKEDPSAARVLYRAIWRQNQDGRIFRSFSRTAAPAKQGTVGSTGRSRGGIPKSYDLPWTRLGWKPDPWKPAQPDRTQLPYLLTKAPFGIDELQRQLRSTPPANLASPETNLVLSALGEASIAKDGEDAIAPLLAEHRAGTASAHDYARLFVLLRSLEDKPDGVTRDTLDAILDNVGGDVILLRRLAGLYARFKFPARASALYSWCAANPGPLGPLGRPMGLGSGGQDLLAEVLGRLKGQHRSQAVATILRATRFRFNDRIGLDRFESHTLSMLIALDGPGAALGQARNLIESLFNANAPPRRETAMVAAGLLARAGEPRRALRLVDISLLAAQAPATARPHELHLWSNQRNLIDDDLRWLFPLDTADFKNAGEWFEAAAVHTQSLRKNDQLSKDMTFKILCLLAIRLEAAGRHDAATGLIPDIELASDNPRNGLWVADVLRGTGNEDDAHTIERALLDEGRLHPERIPQVVAAVFEREGAAAARKLGDPLTKYTLHPDLLDILVRAARQDGDDAAAIRWAELADRAAKAADKLDGK